MRFLPLFLGMALFAGCTGGSDDGAVPEEPLLAGGYKALLDAGSTDPGQFTVTDTADVVRFTTGPAGVAWRPQDEVIPGDIWVEGTLHLYGAPIGYREGYGIFVGGQDMGSATISYVYLMVRATGEFTIRRRRGGTTEALVEWTSHATVQRVTDDGDEPVNTLAVLVRGADTEFLVNGTVVFRMDTAEIDLHGLTGLRINHRLDVGVTAWSLGPPPAPPETPGSTSGT